MQRRRDVHGRDPSRGEPPEAATSSDPSATQNQKLGRASLIAHETAHMWFGDLVTMRWFNDVWMKKVFANFMAAKIPASSFCWRFSAPATSSSRSAGWTRRSADTGPRASRTRVRSFVEKLSQDYPERLRRIVLSSADDLFRASRARER